MRNMCPNMMEFENEPTTVESNALTKEHVNGNDNYACIVISQTDHESI